MQRVSSFSKSVRSLTSSKMGNILTTPDKAPSSVPVILALLGFEGPERDLFIKEVTGTDLVRDQNTQNGAKASIFKGVLANRNIWLVDCPSLSTSDKEFIEAVKTTILKEYTGSKGAVDGIVYFHDITDTNVKDQASRNQTLFTKLQKPGQDNVMIVTTQWSRNQTSEEGERTENDLKEAYGYASPLEASNVRQSHESTGEESNYVAIARELIATTTISSRIGTDQLAKMSLQDLIAIITSKENELIDLRSKLRTALTSHAEEIETSSSARQAVDDELKQAQTTISSLQEELKQQQEEFSSEKQSMVEALENAQATVNHLRVDLERNHDETSSEISRLQQRFSSDKKTLEDKIHQLEGKISTIVLSGRVYIPDETLSISAGSKLNVLDSRGEFPLYKAAAGGHCGDVKQMLEQGANPSLRTWYKWTALHWAVNNGHKDVVELLLSHGADVNAMSDTGKTPLSMAHDDDIRQLLIQRGAA
ncbi:ankyrin repeat-containing protein, putative [Paecilomyces variotii No. 5]|uniref:Ankyrin repeat-containing protein, putative n=1 Tax=Byssochlamys spectabilis (strain No. 5 / NBRC 109023) TaxID=1356009 RepID=V5FUJ4_BYSSN|nr:ankyrin repeat-containing protein, putative [Paecilomyces variotii No. 5]